jgi:hypothetical protein
MHVEFHVPVELMAVAFDDVDHLLGKMATLAGALPGGRNCM